MTHHQFGSMIDTGFPAESSAIKDNSTEGIIEMTDAILMRESAAFAIAGDEKPMFALQLVGRINKTEDSFSGVFVMSWLDAGMVVGEIMKSAARGGDEAYHTMEHGVELAIQELEKEIEENARD